MRYADYEYLYPPRPSKAIPRMMIPVIEKRGWIAQAKKNGTCNVLAVAPSKQLKCMNRHKEDHKLWAPTEASSAAFQTLPGNGWYVFVAELLHSKVTGGPRDTNYINDILVCDGEYLIGETFEARQERIKALFLRGGEAETESHYVVNNNTWVAKNLTKGFGRFYDEMTKDEDEGVVLKDPKAPLTFCSREAANESWSVKSRRPHKNYGF